MGPRESKADWLNSYGKRDGKSDLSFLPIDDKTIAEAIFGKQPDEIEQIKTAFATSSPSMSLETVIGGLYPGSAQHLISSSCGNLASGRAVLRILRADREHELLKQYLYNSWYHKPMYSKRPAMLETGSLIDTPDI